MNRVRSGFHDINREFVTADARVEYIDSEDDAEL
jgi:hypothetical protein